MSSPDLLVARIRGEYREMPGLRLTYAQACRLWQLDAATCEGVLQSLLAQNFLVRTANGSFMALPTPQVGVGDAAQSDDGTEWNGCFTSSSLCVTDAARFE